MENEELGPVILTNSAYWFPGLTPVIVRTVPSILHLGSNPAGQKYSVHFSSRKNRNLVEYVAVSTGISQPIL